MYPFMFRALTACGVALLSFAACAQAPSRYVGQEHREIKVLSPQEIADYLSGNGMGLAKAAELNGYPGPAHVLELGARLALTADQRATTEAVFKRMKAGAVALGERVVAEERALDTLFSSHAVTAEALSASLERIARLQAELRRTHLEAHLEQVKVLTAEQIERYAALRGYRMHEHRP